MSYPKERIVMITAGQSSGARGMSAAQQRAAIRMPNGMMRFLPIRSRHVR